ncbi:uroporphyrinogen-III synthase [Rhodoligotrophos ferricapiens]|uniref:uroporphyrinogen-III synthase n=1 Tax=Rhodoligotrophos ferricapiens TaxID=3069264 RepID=UPI00315C9953
MRLVVTRPQEDAAALASRLETMGHEVLIEPLLRIKPLPDGTPRLPYQAILLSSAHAARLLAKRVDLHSIPVLAVGETTAAAAAEAGFSRVEAAAGDAASLLALALERLSPKAGVILYATGQHIARDLNGDLERRGYVVQRSVLYEAEPAVCFSDALVAALKERQVDGAVLLSARTASVWCGLAEKAGLRERLGGVMHFCLSAAVAEAITRAWGESLHVAVAAEPTLNSIMDRIGAA